MPATKIWASGLKAAVNTGPLFSTQYVSRRYPMPEVKMHAEVKNSVVGTHKNITQSPECLQDRGQIACFILTKATTNFRVWITATYVHICSAYKRRPRGGGTSYALNPLMQMVCPACSSFTMYCSTKAISHSRELEQVCLHQRTSDKWTELWKWDDGFPQLHY